MSEKISTETYINHKMDDSALCATMGLMNDLKRNYVEARIGKDAYDFFETISAYGDSIEASSPFPLIETAESVEYYASLANIAAWINATSQQYLPDTMKVCGVDGQSVSVSVQSDKLADAMRLGVIYRLDDDSNIGSSAFIIDQGPRTKVNDQQRPVDLSEFNEKSVFGVDIVALKRQITEALIETYRVWQNHYTDDQTTLLS